MQVSGGIDSYTNAISDVYQDNFGEGIFTGKGIYDLKVFYNVMKNKIPENTVLSHDLLEGSILRCGLSSDIMLLDGYPSTYLSYITRMERWIRGDIQVLPWIKKGYLNKLSKYKIIDNIRRNLVTICVILNLIILSLAKIAIDLKVWQVVLITIGSIIIPSVLDIINYIIFRKENVKTQKRLTKRIEGIKASIYRGIITIFELPTKGYIILKTFIKTIYRMNITKKHLLEWTTAEEAEKKNKNNIKSINSLMKVNYVFGAIAFFLCFILNINIIAKIGIALLSCLWLIAPTIMWYISKTRKIKKAIDDLNKEEKEYFKNIAKDTWKYFLEFMNKENNFLPPDNYQESRREKIVYRTSSTNIGLGLMTIISAYDMNFLSLEKAISMIEEVIKTIQKLDKWNGHLYNWYNTKDLKPLIPRYVSTVDSGNFVRILIYFKRFFRRT